MTTETNPDSHRQFNAQRKCCPMKPEAQRIAIAEACGYKPYPWFTGEFLMKQGNLGPPFWSKDGKDAYLPDYLNDLNAMHEAEKVLKEGREQDTYAAALGDLTSGRQIDLGALQINATTKIIFATAAQRAEAFLRTLGLWKE